MKYSKKYLKEGLEFREETLKKWESTNPHEIYKNLVENSVEINGEIQSELTVLKKEIEFYRKELEKIS